MAMNLLKWTLAFFVAAILAAFLGFGGVAGAMAGVAKLTFYVFIAFAVVSLVVSLTRSSTA